ncbi:unnamed protein product [Victoria cruziana]
MDPPMPLKSAARTSHEPSNKELSWINDQRKSIDVFNPNRQFTSDADNNSSTSGPYVCSRETIEASNFGGPIEREQMPASDRFKESVDKWMTFSKGTPQKMKENLIEDQMDSPLYGKEFPEGENGSIFGKTSKHLSSQVQVSSIFSGAGMAERAAEWGLVIKTDQSVGVTKKSSGEDAQSTLGKFPGSNRSSEESNQGESSFSTVPKELKDALSTLQQTFVVSDATRPDCPIMYASAGFFSMTGYTPKEVIGRNWSKRRTSSLARKEESETIIQPEILMTKDIERSDSWDRLQRGRDIRQGIDLATTLERIEKNFVITDPRLPDNPIIFASDSFLELTEYTREEILGRNCRFLQGPETDQDAVSKIRDAIREQREATVQLINYTKSGKKFWNLFHLQPMRDQKGALQYFIGVQLDGSDHVQPLQNRLSEASEMESTKLVKATAENVDEAVRELPDANLTPEDLWAIHSKPVFPKPHKKDSSSWKAIQKVHRACIEREIISMLDHPFLPTLYTSFQTATHVCLITDFCPGGELFALLDKQPMKLLKEDAIVRNSLKTKKRRSRNESPPTFLAEPTTQSNSFVGTEEYIAPVSLEARQLIYRLLHRDPINRLGSNGGANEIKKHPFFRGINWPLIRCMMPPQLDVPMQMIKKESNTFDWQWEDDKLMILQTSDIF